MACWFFFLKSHFRPHPGMFKLMCVCVPAGGTVCGGRVLGAGWPGEDCAWTTTYCETFTKMMTHREEEEGEKAMVAETESRKRKRLPIRHIMMYCLLCGAVSNKERSKWPSQLHYSLTCLFYTTLPPDPLISCSFNWQLTCFKCNISNGLKMFCFTISQR